MNQKFLLIILGIVLLAFFFPFETINVVEYNYVQTFDMKGYDFKVSLKDDYRVFDGCSDLSKKNNLCANSQTGIESFSIGSQTYSCPIYEYSHDVWLQQDCAQYRCKDAKTGNYVSRWQTYNYAKTCGPTKTEGGVRYDKKDGCAFTLEIYKDETLVFSKEDFKQQFNTLDISTEDPYYFIAPTDDLPLEFSLSDVDIKLSGFGFDSFNDCNFDLRVDNKEDSFLDSSDEFSESGQSVNVSTSWWKQFLSKVKNFIQTFGGLQ